MNRARSFPWGHFGTPATPGPPSQRKGPGNEDGGFHARFFAEHAHFSFTTGAYWTAACFRVWCAYIVRGNLKLTVSFIFLPFSTPELFSFAHDRRREELWGTLDQALSLFVVGWNKESASDWSICDAVKFERALRKPSRPLGNSMSVFYANHRSCTQS